MASTNKTPHLGLNQWVMDDPFLMEDMNADNQRLDTAVYQALSRDKLFDVTLSEATRNIDLDFSEIDLSRYAMLELYLNFFGLSSRMMRIDNISTESYTIFFSQYGSSPISGIQITEGCSTLTLIGNQVQYTPSLPQTNSGTSINRAGLGRKFSTLNFYPNGGSQDFHKDSRFVIYGVRL